MTCLCSQPTKPCHCCQKPIAIRFKYCDECRVGARRSTWRESKRALYAREKAQSWRQIKAIAS